MAQPTFRTRKEWFRWYSNVYLQCHYWRHVVRPAVFKYRNGICCFCNKEIVDNYWHCHHGEGAYKYIGNEHKHLDMMYVAHIKCHQKYTKKTRKVGLRALFRF